jgi:hypothetical protein
LSAEPPDQQDLSRELSLGESFTKSFDLARRNYLQLLPIFAAFGILVAIISTFITSVTPTYTLPTDASALSQPQLLAAMSSVFRYLGYVAANFLVTWSILYFAAGIGVWKICQTLGKNQKLGFTLPNQINYVNLAITAFLAVVMIEASIIVIVGPLVLGTMFYLSLVSSVIEGKSPLDSLGRSKNLISGKWGKTFILLIGIQIIIYIASSLIGALIGFLPLSDATSILAVNAAQNFILALEFPLVSASMVVLFSSYKYAQVRTVQKPPSLYDNMRPEPMGNFGQAGLGRRSFCPACATSVSPDERFCHNCGAVLSAT